MTAATFCDKLNDYYSTVGGNAVPEKTTPGNDDSPSHALDPLSIRGVELLLNRLYPTKSKNLEDFSTMVSIKDCEDICIPLTDIINRMLGSSEFPMRQERSQIRSPPTQKCSARLSSRTIGQYHFFSIVMVCKAAIIGKLRSKLEEIIQPLAVHIPASYRHGCIDKTKC